MKFYMKQIIANEKVKIKCLICFSHLIYIKFNKLYISFLLLALKKLGLSLPLYIFTIKTFNNCE